MSPGAAQPRNVALPDQSLPHSVHLAHRLAMQHCRHAIGGDCNWYHGVWQYLRALGVLKTAGGHASFFGDTLRALAAGGSVRRVLISGAADDAMALIALEAFREVDAPLELTMVDRCEAPLALSRWSAARVGATMRTSRADMLDFAGEAPFDVVMMSSFLAFITPAARPRLFAHVAGLLRSGGKLLFTNRLRPGAPDAPVGFTAAQADGFCTKVRREVERQHGLLGLDPATVERWAREYTARFRAFPLRSFEEVMELLRPAGFSPDRLDTTLFPGMPGAETIAGPSAADRAEYARVLATRA